jgi:transposase InsO family protein
VCLWEPTYPCRAACTRASLRQINGSLVSCENWSWWQSVRAILPVTTKSEQGASVAANLLQQDFHADQPNQKWTSDTTYIWTQEGWLYLAVVLDLFSRMVVGWAMAAVQDTTLVVHALRDGSGSSLSPSRVTAPLGSWQHLHFRKLCRTCPAQ